MEGRELHVGALAELLQEEMGERKALQDMVISGAENRGKKVHEVSNVTVIQVIIRALYIHTCMYIRQ